MAGTKIARFSHAGSPIIDVWREGPAVLCSVMILYTVSKEMKKIYKKVNEEKELNGYSTCFSMKARDAKKEFKRKKGKRRKIGKSW